MGSVSPPAVKTLSDHVHKSTVSSGYIIRNSSLAIDLHPEPISTQLLIAYFGSASLEKRTHVFYIFVEAYAVAMR